MLRRAGHFVPAGVPLMRISRGERLPDSAGDEFRKAFDIGPSRTLQQDVEFGVLQIVDIALRAISPAVNDPSTAINGIDQLSRILIQYASRQEPASVIYDLPGEVRLIVPWIDFEGLLDSAFEQIRHYGATDVAVCLRLLRALGDIAISTSNGEVRRLAVSRGKRVLDGCAREKMEGQMPVMEERQRALEELAGASGDEAG